jgi:hypothetical protein
VTTVPDILVQLNVALDGLSAAMQSGDPEAVLAAEVPLSAAARAVAAIDPATVAPSASLAAALLEVRCAVERCIHLGRTSGDLLAIVTGQSSYGPTGRHVAGAPSRHTHAPEVTCRA